MMQVIQLLTLYDLVCCYNLNRNNFYNDLKQRILLSSKPPHPLIKYDNKSGPDTQLLATGIELFDCQLFYCICLQLRVINPSAPQLPMYTARDVWRITTGCHLPIHTSLGATDPLKGQFSDSI